MSDFPKVRKTAAALVSRLMPWSVREALDEPIPDRLLDLAAELEQALKEHDRMKLREATQRKPEQGEALDDER